MDNQLEIQIISLPQPNKRKIKPLIILTIKAYRFNILLNKLLDITTYHIYTDFTMRRHDLPDGW